MLETKAKTKRCPMMGGAYCVGAECMAWRRARSEGWCDMLGGDASISLAIDNLADVLDNALADIKAAVLGSRHMGDQTGPATDSASGPASRSASWPASRSCRHG